MKIFHENIVTKNFRIPQKLYKREIESSIKLRRQVPDIIIISEANLNKFWNLSFVPILIFILFCELSFQHETFLIIQYPHRSFNVPTTDRSPSVHRPSIIHRPSIAHRPTQRRMEGGWWMDQWTMDGRRTVGGRTMIGTLKERCGYCIILNLRSL